MGRIGSWLKFGGAGVLGFVATLPLVAGSCGRTACVVVGPGEGACPTANQAMMRITVPGCTGPVMSVDGPGERDGELCCYPVTQAGDDNIDCIGGIGGFGGVGGFSGEGGGGFCGTDGDPCSVDSDCCDGFCGGENACGGSCRNDGDVCSTDGDCCSFDCNSQGVCGGNCALVGDPCDPAATSGDMSCCPGLTCDSSNQCQ